MTASQPPLTALAAQLEDILVAEFRAFGELVDCTRAERAHLSQADLAGLTSLLEQKEKTLGELNRLEQRREATLAECGTGAHRPQTLTDLLPQLDAPLAERIRRLREGILVLVERQQALAHGNRLLAAAALDRAQALRDFLIRVDDPLAGYRPPGAAAGPAPVASLAIEQWA